MYLNWLILSNTQLSPSTQAWARDLLPEYKHGRVRAARVAFHGLAHIGAADGSGGALAEV